MLTHANILSARHFVAIVSQSISHIAIILTNYNYTTLNPMKLLRTLMYLTYSEIGYKTAIAQRMHDWTTGGGEVCTVIYHILW